MAREIVVMYVGGGGVGRRGEENVFRYRCSKQGRCVCRCGVEDGLRYDSQRIQTSMSREHGKILYNYPYMQFFNVNVRRLLFNLCEEQHDLTMGTYGIMSSPKAYFLFPRSPHLHPYLHAICS